MKQVMVFLAVILPALFADSCAFGKDSDVRSAKEQALPRFGAYYVQGRVRDLRDPALIDSPFEAYSHIQVLFDQQSVKFDFPRGSHAPYMVTENGIKFTNEWIETIDPENCESFCEPIMDRQGRYSRTRIIENTDARVVIHWRFALADHRYRLAHVAEDGWSDCGRRVMRPVLSMSTWDIEN